MITVAALLSSGALLENKRALIKMNKKIIVLIHFLILITGVYPVSIQGKQIIDHMGRTVLLPDSPGRVVTLSPGITEVAYSLGRGDLLVGATLYSTIPEAAKNLPKVGSYVRLDLEKILALKPDLCIGTSDGNQSHVVDRLESLGVPVVVVYPKNIRGIQDMISLMGTVLNASEHAKKLTGEMRKQLQRIQEKVKNITYRPKVFYQVDMPPIVSVGEHTFLNELIYLAGGDNTTAGPKDYPRYSWEEVLRLQPEVVLISSMAGGLTPDQLIRKWNVWKQIPAVKKGKVYILNGDLFNRPTARLITGLEVIARKIHPELF